MKFLLLKIHILFLLSIHTSAQTLEDRLFGIEGFEEREIIERLERLKENPLDLNRATSTELLQIPWFYPALVNRILLRRKELGGFENLSQLKEISGISETIFELVTPYLIVKPLEREEIPLMKRFGKGRIRGRVIETKPLEDEEKYLGDSRRVYTRLDFEPMERLSMGILTEKDPGEESYTDLLNYNLEWKTGGRVEKVILGYYEMDFGEGLLFSSSSFTFKGTGIVKGSEKGLRPYHSSDENGGLYGGALQSKMGNFEVSLFSSFSKLDGTINEDGTVMSLYEGGEHRTETEVSKKDRVRETLLGGRLSYHSRGMKLGITGGSGSYDPVFEPEDDPRNPFPFKGRRYSLMGSDFEIPIRDMELFGEVGYSLDRGWGTIVGILYHLRPLDAAILYRNYDEEFYSPHSSAFSNSDDENEAGSFAQLSYRLSPETTLRGYLDLYRYPERRYFEDLPTKGREFRGEIEHRFRENLEVEGRIWKKGKEEYSSEDERIRWRERKGIRISGNWKKSNRLGWTGRLEVVESSVTDLDEKEDGNLVFGGFQYRPFKTTSLDTRLIFFDTDSYESRIYEYERDLPGVVSNPALFGKGRRFYLLLNQKLKKILQISGKFSTTYQEGSSTEAYGIQMDLKW